MAVKAFATISDHTRDNNDNARIFLQVRVSILGSDEGTYSGSEFTLEIPDLNPTLGGAQFKAVVADAVKDDMEAHEIDFGPLDVVVVYPSA